MANDQNQCNFTGNLGKDPESRATSSGQATSNFSIAVGRSWKNKETGQKEERTEWVPISVYGKLAEICNQYLQKGSKVRITGEFRTRKWQDNNGQDRYTTEIVASELQMLGGRSGNDSGNNTSTAPAPSSGPDQGAPSIEFSDDIPF